MHHDPSHPVGLAFRDGRFSYYLPGGISDYVMKGSEVLIISKLSSASFEKRARFTFQLSEKPDGAWKGLFEKEALDIPPGMNRQDFLVSFDSDTVVLTCLAANLEGKYRHLKDSISRANVKYAAARSHAMEVGRRRDEEEQRERELKKTAQQRVQSLFDKLEL